jgi:hypothetical protein
MKVIGGGAHDHIERRKDILAEKLAMMGGAPGGPMTGISSSCSAMSCLNDIAAMLQAAHTDRH